MITDVKLYIYFAKPISALSILLNEFFDMYVLYSKRGMCQPVSFIVIKMGNATVTEYYEVCFIYIFFCFRKLFWVLLTHSLKRTSNIKIKPNGQRFFTYYGSFVRQLLSRS